MSIIGCTLYTLTKGRHEFDRGAGFKPKEDGTRGFDHGVFVPLKLAYPLGIPTVQLSLLSSLDPQVPRLLTSP